MGRHLQREIDNLRRELVSIGALVEQAVGRAIVAFEERRLDLVERIVEDDGRIDEKEVEVEETCLKLLALYQPVAEDLRFIAAVMKINNDLERMGDYAVSIAWRVEHMASNEPQRPPREFRHLSDLAREMVRRSLDAFVKGDTRAARELCADDDKVDEVRRRIVNEVKSNMQENPITILHGLDVIAVVNRLERLADLATNIAEDVIYMVEGEIVRHRPN